MSTSHLSEALNPCSLLSAPVSITGTVPDADFSVMENETISLLCNVEGSPAPTATWSKVGGESAASYLRANENKADLEQFPISHLRIVFCLFAKTSLCVKPFITKMWAAKKLFGTSHRID